MHMNHLIAFIKVVQTKSFKAAAKQLAITQPAVSMRVQALEEHFGTKLITRLSDGIQLTSEGELAYEQIQAILLQWEMLEVNLKGHKTSGTIKLGASTIPSEYLLPSLLKSFKQTYPEINLNTFVSGSHDIIQLLTDGTVDIIITGKQKQDSHIISKKLIGDQIVIIAPPNFEAINQIRDMTDFVHLDWILREPNSNTRRVSEEAFEKNGILDKLHVVAQMGSTEAVIAAVEAGLGVSVVSSLAAERAASFGRVQVIDPCIFSIERDFYISTLKENIKHPMIHAFIEFALSHSYKN